MVKVMQECSILDRSIKEGKKENGSGGSLGLLFYMLGCLVPK